LKYRLGREAIALRAAKEFQDGWVVNLGLGVPTLASRYIPEGKTVIFHSQNGVLGLGPPLTEDEMDRADYDLINAGAQFATPKPGMSFFSHADSFAMIRGGHIDATVLGGLQVSERGDLANWFSPGTEVEVIGLNGVGSWGEESNCDYVTYHQGR